MNVCNPCVICCFSSIHIVFLLLLLLLLPLLSELLYPPVNAVPHKLSKLWWMCSKNTQNNEKKKSKYTAGAEIHNYGCTSMPLSAVLRWYTKMAGRYIMYVYISILYVSARALDYGGRLGHRQKNWLQSIFSFLSFMFFSHYYYYYYFFLFSCSPEPTEHTTYSHTSQACILHRWEQRVWTCSSDLSDSCVCFCEILQSTIDGHGWCYSSISDRFYFFTSFRSVWSIHHSNKYRLDVIVWYK